MKKITYFNKEVREDLDMSIIESGITEDCFEIKQLAIDISDEDLDYYMNIINTSYASYGEVMVSDIEEQPTELEILQQQLFNTQTELLQTQAENSDLGSQLFNLQTTLVEKGLI